MKTYDELREIAQRLSHEVFAFPGVEVIVITLNSAPTTPAAVAGLLGAKRSAPRLLRELADQMEKAPDLLVTPR